MASPRKAENPRREEAARIRDETGRSGHRDRDGRVEILLVRSRRDERRDVVGEDSDVERLLEEAHALGDGPRDPRHQPERRGAEGRGGLLVELQTAHPRHVTVRDDQVDLAEVGEQHGEAGLAVLGLQQHQLDILARERARHRAAKDHPDDLVVIDDQQSQLAHQNSPSLQDSLRRHHGDRHGTMPQNKPQVKQYTATQG